MLDSTAAVAAERQGKNARQLLESMAVETGDDEIAISVITVLELAHGITRADTIERRERRQRFLDELLRGVPIQPVTVPIALRAGPDRRPKPIAGRPHPALGSADRGARSGTGLRSCNVKYPPLPSDPRRERHPGIAAPSDR